MKQHSRSHIKIQINNVLSFRGITINKHCDLIKMKIKKPPDTCLQYFAECFIVEWNNIGKFPF